MTALRTIRVVCTNKLCDYKGKEAVSDNHPIYEKKTTCPKCGFKTLDMYFGSLRNFK